MTAPEKIYLYPSDRAGEEYEDEWGTFPWGEDCVEYVRTDAFIKKTCDFLKDRIEHDSIDYPIATKHFIDDYIKYMKENNYG